MSDIERLRVVATVAETRSITEAARVHRIAQSTVSRSVAAAERLVGFPLFRRDSAGVQLVAGARPAIVLIERIVEEFDALRALNETRAAAIRIAHREEITLPGMLDSAIVRWNRESDILAVAVVHADPIGALRAGDAEFAAVWNSAELVEDVRTEVLTLSRAGRLELLSPVEPSPEGRAFLRSIR
jgi:DNA-binding transcriptional LysR family regulator